MKTGSANLITHIGQEVTTLTTLWRIQREDGTVDGMTDLDIDVTWDDGDGSVVYRTVAGYSRSSVGQKAGIQDGEVDVEGLFDAAGLVESDFRAGLLDHAQVRVHLINYNTLADGSFILKEGRIGEVTTSSMFLAELRGLIQAYRQEIVSSVIGSCDAHFGDSGAAKPRCYLDIDPNAWSKSLATVARVAADAKNETVVKPTTPDDRNYVATNVGLTGPTEPTWDTTIGNTTTETLTVSIWITATSYPANEQILENGLIWVSDGGTSGGVEPTWTSTPGDTIADNDIIWTAFAATAAIWEAVQSRRIAATVASITTNMKIVLTVTTDAPDIHFKMGFVIFTSGPNVGVHEQRGIADWELSTKTLTFFEPFPFVIGVGDALTVVAGCDRTKARCTTFDNVINFRGFPDLPKNDQIFRIPNQPPSG